MMELKWCIAKRAEIPLRQTARTLERTFAPSADL